MRSPLKVLVRFVAHEKGLFAGAIVVAGIAGALGVPVDFVLFALTLPASRSSTTTRCRSR